jgi:hypothetical protein
MTPSVSPSRDPGSPATAERLRLALLLLAAIGTVTTAVELAFLRHWTNLLELIPWASLALLGVAIVALAFGPTRRRVQGARAAAVVTGIVAVLGVAIHVWKNYEAAPLDLRYSATWETTAEPIRWILAFTDTVGPAPSLAPTALAFVCTCLFLATLGHPSLETADGAAGSSQAS